MYPWTLGRSKATAITAARIRSKATAITDAHIRCKVTAITAAHIRCKVTAITAAHIRDCLQRGARPIGRRSARSRPRLRRASRGSTRRRAAATPALRRVASRCAATRCQSQPAMWRAALQRDRASRDPYGLRALQAGAGPVARCMTTVECWSAWCAAHSVNRAFCMVRDGRRLSRNGWTAHGARCTCRSRTAAAKLPTASATPALWAIGAGSEAGTHLRQDSPRPCHPCPHLRRALPRPCPHLRRDLPHLSHICARTRLAAAHICARTCLAPAHICAGTCAPLGPAALSPRAMNVAANSASCVHR